MKRILVFAIIALLSRACTQESGMENKRFSTGGIDYSVDEMIAANADDAEFCAWLREASVGDVFPDGEGCERLADAS
jgi:hypothetical protein